MTHKETTLLPEQRIEKLQRKVIEFIKKFTALELAANQIDPNECSENYLRELIQQCHRLREDYNKLSKKLHRCYKEKNTLSDQLQKTLETLKKKFENKKEIIKNIYCIEDKANLLISQEQIKTLNKHIRSLQSQITRIDLTWLLNPELTEPSWNQMGLLLNKLNELDASYTPLEEWCKKADRKILDSELIAILNLTQKNCKETHEKLKNLQRTALAKILSGYESYLQKETVPAPQLDNPAPEFSCSYSLWVKSRSSQEETPPVENPDCKRPDIAESAALPYFHSI